MKVLSSANMTSESENETSARYTELFKKLDKGGDGRIDIKDLTAALKDLGMCESYAAVSRTTEINLHSNVLHGTLRHPVKSACSLTAMCLSKLSPISHSSGDFFFFHSTPRKKIDVLS